MMKLIGFVLLLQVAAPVPPAPDAQRFSPKADPVAVGLWTRGERAALVAHYERTGYPAMAALLRGAGSEPVLRMKNNHWLCPIESQAPTSCEGLVRSATQTLEAAAMGEDVPADVYETALRTVVTADVEMGYWADGAPREWPYQNIVFAALRRNDPTTAVIAAELAQARLHERRAAGEPVTPAGEEQIRKLLERARAAARK